MAEKPRTSGESPFDPSEKADTATDKPEKSSRFRGWLEAVRERTFLDSWLARRRAAELNESDDETETERRPLWRRVRRFGRSLLNQAEAPASTERESDTEQTRLELPERRRPHVPGLAEVTPETTVDAPESLEPDADHPLDTDNEEAESVPPELPPAADAEPLAADAITEDEEDDPLTPPIPPLSGAGGGGRGRGGGTRGPGVPPSPPRGGGGIPPAAMAAAGGAAPAPGMAAGNIAARTPNVVLPPHRHGEPLAIVGLAGLAYEHHRVTKLKRGTEQLKQELKEVKKTTPSLEHEQHQMEEQIQRFARRLEVKPPTFSQNEVLIKPETPPAQEISERLERQLHEVTTKVELEREAQVPPEVIQPTVERQTVPQNLKEIVTTPYKMGTPEAVLQQVEKAVEHNVPLETLYELRQEIKDEATTPQAKMSSSSLGSMPTTGSSVPSGGPFINPSQPSQPSPSAPIDQLIRKDKNLYRTAVISGAWASIVLLLFLAAFFLLKH